MNTVPQPVITISDVPIEHVYVFRDSRVAHLFDDHISARYRGGQRKVPAAEALVDDERDPCAVCLLRFMARQRRAG